MQLKHHLLTLLSLLVLIFAGMIVPAPSPAVADTSTQPFDLQVDLQGLAYYTTEIPFKDLMAQQIGWMKGSNPYGATCNPVAVDAEGYPTQTLKGTGCSYYNWLMLHMPVTPATNKFPPGHYVLTYMGSGTVSVISGSIAKNQKNISPGRIEFDVVTPGDLFTVTIFETDPNDHVRDMHVFLASDESNLKTQPFQQTFLNELAPYKILRFMDWSGVSTNVKATTTPVISQPDPKTLVLSSYAPSTDGYFTGMTVNHIFVTSYDGATHTVHLANNLSSLSSATFYKFLNQTWSSRSTTDITKQAGQGGIAYEYMVALANTLNKDMWINVPTAADDDYVRNLAQYLKSNLNSNLKIYIEYSNETWNFSYPGYDYSWAMTQKMNLPGPAWVGGDQWHPYRAVQIFQIFNSVFNQQDLRVNRTSSDRLVRMIATQTGWVDRAIRQVDWVMPNNAAPTFGHKAYEYADAWAVTDYWGLPSGAPCTLATCTNEQLIDLQKQSIAEEVASSSTKGTNYLYQLATQAKTRGLKLNQYEGGVGFTVPDGNQATVDRITALMRDPRMEDVQGEALIQWAKLAQAFPGTIGTFAVFSDVGSYSRYGFWGALESSMQDPKTVPRYKAFLNYVNGTLLSTPSTPTTPTPTTATTTSTPTPTTATPTTTVAPTVLGDLLQPVNLRATAITTSSLTLRWRAPEDSRVVSYNVYRDGTKLANITAKSYTDSNVTAGVKYRYTVESVDAAGNTSKPFGTTEWIPTTSTPPVKTTTTTTTTATPTTNTTTNTTQTQYLLTRLGPGSSGSSVALLQKFLVADDYLVFPAGTSYGYYGALTQQAVAKFQIQKGLVTSGTPATTGFGAVGPKTLVSINAHINADTSLVSAVLAPTPVVTPVASVKPTSVAVPSSPTASTPVKSTPAVQTEKCDPKAISSSIGTGVLPQNLSLGACSSQVITLQEILNSFGYPIAEAGSGSLGKESTYYGPSTEAAVAKFQAAYGLTKDKKGALGDETREKLNYMFSNGLNPRYQR